MPHGSANDRTRKLSKATATPPFSPVLARRPTLPERKLASSTWVNGSPLTKTHLGALPRHTQSIHSFPGRIAADSVQSTSFCHSSAWYF